MRILVVDDEPALQRLMTMYLSRTGYSVTTTDTAEAGFEILSQSAADFGLVILDGTLPGANAEQLALRMLGVNPALRIIVSSGYPVDMTALLGAAPGRAMFLQKPFTSQTLSAAVRRMLGEEEGLSDRQGSEGHRAGAGGAGSGGSDH